MLVLAQGITGLISTNLTQPRLEWSNTTVYSATDEVTYKNYIYRSIVNENSGIDPSLNTGKWLLFGVDNSFAAIDLHSLTESTIDDGLDYIEFVFASVGFTMLALRGVMGLSVDLYEYDSSDVQIGYQNRSTISERLCSDNWFNYYFCNIQSETTAQAIDMTFSVIQPQTEKIKIRLHKRTDGRAAIATMVGGRAFDIGATRFGITGGFIDYSIRNTDGYGITTITRRNVKETMSGELIIDSLRTQTVKRYIKNNCMGVTVIFIADPDQDSSYENLTMLGFITDFEITISNPIKSYGIIEIEESL